MPQTVTAAAEALISAANNLAAHDKENRSSLQRGTYPPLLAEAGEHLELFRVGVLEFFAKSRT